MAKQHTHVEHGMMRALILQWFYTKLKLMSIVNAMLFYAGREAISVAHIFRINSLPSAFATVYAHTTGITDGAYALDGRRTAAVHISRWI